MIPLRILRNACKQCFQRNFATDAKAEVTALYDFHVEKGGKMVNFGGFMLPVQYSDQSIINSHLFTRKSASLFDVSHMLQTEIFGKDCIKYMESLCTADIVGLNNGGSTLTIFTNENGGILDDLIVTKCSEDYLYVVSNAARKQHDIKHLQTGLENYKRQYPQAEVRLNFLEPNVQSLIALQGPKAAEALQQLVRVDLSTLYFMNSFAVEVAGVKNCRITRCGYTGEDGFEISVSSKNVLDIVKILLQNENVKLAGLGARDSLRLEAGLCLYGTDISEETSPVEAGLTWLVAKSRRQQQNFRGAEKILQQIKEGVKVKRIGLVSNTGPPARQGTLVMTQENQEIGIVSSGCPSPSVGKNIAMAYVKQDFSKVGTEVSMKIRERLYKAVVTKMPFVSSNYYTKPK